MIKGEISHEGIVRKVGQELTLVEIVSQSACSSCHAEAICSASDSKTKEILVPTSKTETFEEGETVDVVMRASLGHTAVVVSYLVPLIILLVVVVVLWKLQASELIIGLAAMLAIAVWFFIVYLRRRTIAQKSFFYLRKK